VPLERFCAMRALVQRSIVYRVGLQSRSHALGKGACLHVCMHGRIFVGLRFCTSQFSRWPAALIN
jgi:hypothetical protein